MRPDGSIRETSELRASPDEAERASIRDAIVSRYLSASKNPTGLEAQEEIEKMVDEEMKRRQEAAVVKKVIPFPKREDHPEAERFPEKREAA